MRAQLRNTTSEPVLVRPPRCCEAAHYSFRGVVAVESAQSVSLELDTESFNVWAPSKCVRDSCPMNSRVHRLVHNDRGDAGEPLLTYERYIKRAGIRVCGKNLSATSNHENPR